MKTKREFYNDNLTKLQRWCIIFLGWLGIEIILLILLTVSEGYTFMQSQSSQRTIIRTSTGFRYLIFIAFNVVMILFFIKKGGQSEVKPKEIQQGGWNGFAFIAVRIVISEVMCKFSRNVRMKPLDGYDFDRDLVYASIIYLILLTAFTVNFSYAIYGERMEFYYNRQKFLKSQANLPPPQGVPPGMAPVGAYPSAPQQVTMVPTGQPAFIAPNGFPQQTAVITVS